MPELSSENRPSTERSLIILMLAVAGGLSMLYYHAGLFLPRAQEASMAKGLGKGYAFGGDFYPIWLTSREWLAKGRDPYSPEMTREIQQGLFGHPLVKRSPTDLPAEYRTFAYPAFTDLLLWPSAELDFSALRIPLAVFLLLIAAWTIRLWMQALEWHPGPLWLAIIILLTLTSYPVLEALFAEQPGLIVGFLLAASLRALTRDHQLFAGILLALTTVKPQMTLAAILYLLLWSVQDWPRRSRLAGGFFATFFLLIGASLVIWPHWIGSWLKITFGYYRYAPPPLATEILGPTWGARAGPVLIAILLAFAAAAAWKTRRAGATSLEFWASLSLLLAITSVAILPGQAVYDHILLLPGILVLTRHWRGLSSAGRTIRTLQAIGAAVLLWPWVAAVTLIVIRPFMTRESFYSNAVFAMPVRTAASLPFMVLALLALTARAAPRSQIAGLGRSSTRFRGTNQNGTKVCGSAS